MITILMMTTMKKVKTTMADHQGHVIMTKNLMMTTMTVHQGNMTMIMNKMMTTMTGHQGHVISLSILQTRNAAITARPNLERWYMEMTNTKWLIWTIKVTLCTMQETQRMCRGWNRSCTQTLPRRLSRSPATSPCSEYIGWTINALQVSVVSLMLCRCRLNHWCSASISCEGIWRKKLEKNLWKKDNGSSWLVDTVLVVVVKLLKTRSSSVLRKVDLMKGAVSPSKPFPYFPYELRISKPYPHVNWVDDIKTFSSRILSSSSERPSVFVVEGERLEIKDETTN